MQRYFLFYNELDVPIYPVIQAPQAASGCSNPGDLTQLRIYVNDKKKGTGVPKGGMVRVNIPKDKPCPSGGFYNAARILVFLADVNQFEARLKDGAQKGTDLKVPWAKDICANDDDADPACWVALASGPYLPDAPAQLLEYTIISQVGNAKSTKDQNDPDGISVLDFDVSYVDDAYLPVAMAVDGGITAYMGSKLSLDAFSKRLTGFLNTPSADWSEFAAYTPVNYPNAIFSSLVPNRIDKLPSGQQRHRVHEEKRGRHHLDLGLLPLPEAVGRQSPVLPEAGRHDEQPDVRLPERRRRPLLPGAAEWRLSRRALGVLRHRQFHHRQDLAQWVLTDDVDPDEARQEFHAKP